MQARSDPTAQGAKGSRAILAAGTVLLVASLAQPAIAALVEPRWGLGLLATMAAEVVTGREAAIPLALAQGVPPAWVAVTSVLQNLGMAAVAVPAILGGLTRLARHPFLARHARLTEALARRQESRARGAWALFGFMLVPFLSNGAVIAGLIGRWARIPMPLLVAAVFAGVIVTATAWSFGYAALAAALGGIHPALASLPTWLAIIVVAAGVARALWRASSARRMATTAQVR